MLTLPWWIYAVISGIIFSAIMMFKAVKEDAQLEQQFIEKEGEVYIERLNQEKQRRHQEKTIVKN